MKINKFVSLILALTFTLAQANGIFPTETGSNLALCLGDIDTLRPRAAGERDNALEAMRKKYWARWVLAGINHDISDVDPGISFIIKELKAIVRKNQTARIVDLGCGPLYVSKAVKRRFPSSDLVAVDFVDVDIERILGSGGIRFGKASVTDTGFPADYFDAAIVRYVLEHVDRDAMAKELYRILKPGGTAILVLHDPNPKYMVGIARMVIHLRYMVEYFNYLKRLATEEMPLLPPIEDLSDAEYFSQADLDKRFLDEFTRVALDINSRIKKEGRTSEVMALARDFLEKRDADIRPLEQEIEVFGPLFDELERLFASIKEARQFFENKGFNVVSYEGRGGIIVDKKSGEIAGYGLVIRKGAAPVKQGLFSRFLNLLPGRSI